MAVPTVVSCTPDEGHTGGLTLVQVVGTNFRLPTAPPATGPTTAPPPSVRVRFNGQAATQVEVFSATELHCLTPKALDPLAPEGPVVVEVANLDDDGNVIVGELGTLADGFTYRLPVFEGQGHLATVVRTMLAELRRQVLPNTHFATHTDYDPQTGDTLNTAEIQTLPALVLANLLCPSSMSHPEESEVDVDASGGRFVTRRGPVSVDVVYDLIGVSDNPIEILNILHAIRVFFRKNPYLYVPRDPENLAAGDVKYELTFKIASTAAVAMGGQENSNVQNFTGQVAILGVLLEDMPGAPSAGPTGVSGHEAVRRWGYKSEDSSDAIVPTVQPKG